MTVREFLEAINIKDGYGITDNDLLETLIYTGEYQIVWQDKISHQRWYGSSLAVIEIQGKFIKFLNYHVYGDNSLSDMGCDYDIDKMTFVECKTRTVTETYYE